MGLLHLLHLLPFLTLTFANPLMNTNTTGPNSASSNSTKPTYLKANQECGSNNQCSMTCKDGDFHPMSYNGTVYFACTTQEDHDLNYSIWNCKDIEIKDNMEVCEAASGKWCASKGYCVLPDVGGGFEDLCKEKGAKANKIKEGLGYEDVLEEESRM
jgi:hypothetical protein